LKSPELPCGIPRFEEKIEIPDFEFFVRSRLSQAIVIWPEQAFALIGYMGWPNDPQARAAFVAIVRGWPQGSTSMPPRLRQIQFDWAAVADIFSLHCDLTVSGRQRRRGGPSIGKAIELAAALSRSKEMGKANLWSRWGAYKDVAHLVTAACLARPTISLTVLTVIGSPASARLMASCFAISGVDGAASR
jgi:hypothetical protein